MIELTEQQAQAIAVSGDTPPVVVDPKTKTSYVLLRQEVYEQLASEEYDDSPWTDEEMALLAAEAGEMLDSLQGTAGAALEDLRDLARGIYPPVLADQGLGAALEAQARKAAVPTTIEADGLDRFPQDVESAVYFCTLEALNNSRR